MASTTTTTTSEKLGVLEHEATQHPLQPDTKPKNSLTILGLLRLLWLFTESDFYTFAIPDTAFGIFGALAGPLLIGAQPATQTAWTVLARLPLVLASNWLNLLVFDLANQRSPEAAVEDKLNKPWRPLPSGIVTSTQARRMLLATLPIVVAAHFILGPWQESALLACLTYMYNDLRGGDEHFILRNAIISVAFGLYNESSLRIASSNPSGPLTTTGLHWIIIISCVIFTTMHVQDLKDQAGDRSRGRSTAPLVIGDGLARLSVAIPVAIWTIACPAFWQLSITEYIAPVGLGSVIIARILLMRGVKADAQTWQIWASWLAVLYTLPIFKNYSVLAATPLLDF